MNKLRQFEISAVASSLLKAGEGDCPVDKRVGSCSNDVELTYYYWDSCTGKCYTILGVEVDDCTGCTE